MKKILLAAATSLMLTCAGAHAELITNGGFETGNLTNWTNTDGGNFVRGPFDGYQPFGNYALYLGCVNRLCSTSQTIATTAGGSYVFSFEYGSDAGQPNEFIASFDGGEVFHTLNDTTNTRPGFIHESFNVIATTASTLVSFSGKNNPSYQALDNVSVVAGSAVPEPTTIALLGLGLLGLVASRRKSAK